MTKRPIFQCHVGTSGKRKELFSNATAEIKAPFSEGGLAESVHTEDVNAFQPCNGTSRSLRKILVRASENTWLKVFIPLFLRDLMCSSLNIYMPQLRGRW